MKLLLLLMLSVIIAGGRKLDDTPPTFTTTGGRLIPRPIFHDIEFSCEASGSKPMTVTWLHNGVIFNMKQRRYTTTVMTKWKLHLFNIQLTDRGNYTCIVSNRFGEIHRDFVLLIHEIPTSRPVFQTVLYNQTAILGSNVTLFVKVGHDTSSLHWIKNDKDFGLMSAEGSKAYDGGTRRFLQNVTYNDAGKYSCAAYNNIGMTLTEGWLTVIPPPQTTTGGSSSMQLMSSPPRRIPKTAFISIPFMILSVIVGVAFVGKVIYYFMLRYCNTKHIVLISTAQSTIYREDEGQEQPVDDVLQLPEVVVRGRSFFNHSSLDHYEIPVDTTWEFPRHFLSIQNLLGEGQFGRVFKGTARNIIRRGETSMVAVKCLKENANEADLTALIQEVEVMKRIGHHTNIINLLKVCTRKGPLLMILEYASLGCLKTFLRKAQRNFFRMEKMSTHYYNSVIKKVDLLSFALQIAKGMEYLASKKYIHRDIAARNILVAEGNVAKIADFGLTRSAPQEYYRIKTTKCIPVKWTAPEAMHSNVYTTYSDIWSYGVLLWEIFSLGDTPFSHWTLDQVMELVLVKGGKRLKKPKMANQHVYDLMRNCWRWVPTLRPQFSELVAEFEKLLTEESNVEYLTMAATLPRVDEEEEEPVSPEYLAMSQVLQKPVENVEEEEGYLAMSRILPKSVENIELEEGYMAMSSPLPRLMDDVEEEETAV